MATPTQMPSRYSPCTTPKTALRYLPAHFYHNMPIRSQPRQAKVAARKVDKRVPGMSRSFAHWQSGQLLPRHPFHPWPASNIRKWPPSGVTAA
ncbi:hypothetical protein VCV18_011208 [Metarhizium anisopliae]